MSFNYYRNFVTYALILIIEIKLFSIVENILERKRYDLSAFIFLLFLHQYLMLIFI